MTATEVYRIDGDLLARLYRKADAGRWSVRAEAFRQALESGVRRAFPSSAPSPRDLERHLDRLHLADLALACACSAGDERAWEHFIVTHRPVLYRAADALDRTGRAREAADSLYAELYGVRGDATAGSPSGSLLRYFHGRSSLATWLRAVLAQRHVDRVRADQRTIPLDDEQAAALPQPSIAPEQQRYSHLVGTALHAAIAALEPRDRLRLRAYYEQDLTLVQVGRLTQESEATVSRQIARTRKTLRREAERALVRDHGFDAAELERCLASAMDDAGAIDLRRLFGSDAGRKIGAGDRSE